MGKEKVIYTEALMKELVRAAYLLGDRHARRNPNYEPTATVRAGNDGGIVLEAKYGTRTEVVRVT
jgi:hypothetical protein